MFIKFKGMGEVVFCLWGVKVNILDLNYLDVIF